MIIDIHAHVGLSRRDLSSPEDMLRVYDDCGIEKACINSLWITYDPPAGNNEIHEIVKKYPDRFIGFGVINPRWNPNAAAEVDRCITVLNMKGIKLHPADNGWEADSPIVYPVMERIREHGVPVLFHTWHDNLSNPSRVGRLARVFPEVLIIMGHMGGDAFYEAAFLAKELPNIYLDTTGSPTDIRILREVVRIAGKEKIVFGTDAPCCNVYAEAAKIKYGDIPEEAKTAIFYENAKKMLKLK